MGKVIQKATGNSGSEDRFIELFCDAFGADKGQYVYLQYPMVDIYGRHRTIDFAVNLPDGRVAIEVDGNTWHQPGIVSTEKYHDDLLKQNSMVFEGWRVYRWTSAQIDKSPDRVKDELVTFLGQSPLFRYIEDALPPQQGETFELMDHQEEALENLDSMRKAHKTIALLFHATGTGKTVTAVSDAKRFGKRTLFIAHRHELVDQAIKTFQKIWPEVSVGRYEGSIRETDAFVVCGTIQSVSQNLDDFTKGGYSQKDVERLILSMPFKRYEDMHIMHHSKHLGTLQFYKALVRQLTDEDYAAIRESCHAAIARYFGTAKA